MKKLIALILCSLIISCQTTKNRGAILKKLEQIDNRLKEIEGEIILLRTTHCY